MNMWAVAWFGVVHGHGLVAPTELIEGSGQPQRMAADVRAGVVSDGTSREREIAI